MPDLEHPPQLPDVDLEDQPFDLEARLLSQAHSLALVNKTFDQYEAERDSNHLTRWAIHEELYYGRVAQRYWPGSKKKRASLGIPLVMEQEESMLPALCAAIFGQQPYWFSATAVEGHSTPEEAQAIQARMAYWFTLPRDSSGRTTESQLMLTLQQWLHHGNGAGQVGWDENGYFCEWRDIRDLYVDPGLKTPWIDDSPVIIDRQKMTIQDLKSRGGLTLPPDPMLNYLAKTKPLAGSDYARQMAEAYRGLQLNTDILATDPAKQTIDVLRYWTNQRVIWVLGRAWIAYQGKNEYGFKPFFGGPFIPDLSTWWGAAVSDFVEGEQRFQQGVTNTRIDELALAMDPPRTRRRGAYTHPSGLHYRPGLVDQVDKPKDDVIYTMPTGITKESYIEIGMSEQRAARRLGVSEIAMQGGMTRPANTRTAAGVQLQNAGVSNRLYMPLKRIEDFILAPLLYKTARLMALKDTENPVGLFVGENGQQQLQPIEPETLQKKVRFVLSAATRARGQAALQASLPIVLQTYLSGPFIQALAQSGQTVRFDQLDRYVRDATGTANAYSFVGPMSPEQVQAMQQAQQQQAQEKQLDAQTRLQIMQMKTASEQELQAGREAIEVLKLIGTEKNLDKELQVKLLDVLAKAGEKKEDRNGNK